MVSVKERTNLHTAHILFSYLIHLAHWCKVHVYEIFCQEKDIPQGEMKVFTFEKMCRAYLLASVAVNWQSSFSFLQTIVWTIINRIWPD
jgi:hypothetical protein